MLLGSIYRIFLRYADEHAKIDLPGRTLRNAVGADIGVIDRIMVRRNRLVVEGWSEAARIGLKVNRTQQWVTPEQARPGSKRRGFHVDIPFETGQISLTSECADGDHIQNLAGVSANHMLLARLARVPKYFYTLISLIPHIRRWKLQGDLGAREIVKERLGLVPSSDAVEMDWAMIEKGESPKEGQSFNCATLVMPIYNAFDILPEALSRIDQNSDMSWRLILIEDLSSDNRVRPFITAWAEDPARRGQVILLNNTENLGFIGAVNRGFEIARQWPSDPVVLINSDALVPPGWLSRLLAPLADHSVASVTPMSNDAEIFNVPVICRRNELNLGEGDMLDESVRFLTPNLSQAEVPTGVGFCMAMAPAFLSEIPAFDEAFGRGYGEEVDWCQRARQLGGRNVAAINLFVEHRGGISFGSVEKQKLLHANSKRISQRYPSFDQEVQDFIRTDSLTTARLMLGLTWAGTRQMDPIPVYIGHAMGGGAEHDLQDRILAEKNAGRSVVVLRVGQGHRWKLELITPLGTTQGLTNDIELIVHLISRLPNLRLVYSCAVGDRDPVELPSVILRLAAERHEIDVLFHDFFPISPNYTLLDKDGIYRGVPVASNPSARYVSHCIERPGGRSVPLEDWQNAWGKLLTAATTIKVFSNSSRDIVVEAYPCAKKAIQVVPHRMASSVPKIALAPGNIDRPTIAVLGNIGFHKGAAIIQRLSRDLARSRAADLVVIGRIDPAFPLSRGTVVHGSYELRDLPGLVKRYGINCWLIPSIWPETFSFTTHEALATGMPVFCFDLGAQADAVRTAVSSGAAGEVLPLPEGNSLDVQTILENLTRVGTAGRDQT